MSHNLRKFLDGDDELEFYSVKQSTGSTEHIIKSLDSVPDDGKYEYHGKDHIITFTHISEKAGEIVAQSVNFKNV